MKKKILILGCLLSGTTFLSDVRGGVHELFGDIDQRNDRYYASFRLNGNSSEVREFLLSNFERLGYEPQIRAGVNLKHTNNLKGVDLGFVRERVRFHFQDNGEDQIYEGLLQQQYPLYGKEWTCHEDRDHNRDIYTLGLEAQVKDLKVDIQSEQLIQDFVAHHFIRNEGPERTGIVHFDGENVAGIRIIPQVWKSQDRGGEYHHDKKTQDLNVKSHEGNDMVYVEPFSLDGQSKSRSDLRGEYVFERDLTPDESIQGRGLDRLIYSDGENIYLPHVTQERWKRQQSTVDFFLASYRKDRQLGFVQRAVVPNGRLPLGLYQILSIKEKEGGRIEKWLKLGEDGKIVDISSPVGIPSITGMGLSAPYDFFETGVSSKVTDLMTGMTEVESKTSAVQLYPDARESFLIVGPTGSGKSTLFNLIAGKTCIAKEDDVGIVLDIEDPVKGSRLSHDQEVGTKFPVAWYDQNNDRAFIDFSGFGDPRESDADIKNLYTLQRALKGRQNLRILLTLHETFFTQRSRDFHRLLNDITDVFPEGSQWMQGLTLVFTKKTKHSKPDGLLKGIVTSFEDPIKRAENHLTDKSYELLKFFADHPERIQTMPYPEKEGTYAFARPELLERVRNTERLENLAINMNLGTEARVFVGELANGLNSHLEQYMRTEGVRGLVNYCRKTIESHSGTIQDLRSHFASMAQTLSDLTTQNADEFVRVLGTYIKTSEISNIIGRLRFLQGIRNDVQFHIEHWKASLNSLTDLIRNHLVSAPQVEINEGVITVKSVVAGTSEIQAAMRAYPNYLVRVFAGNTLLLDGDIENHGQSLIAFSPYWRAIGERSIDLSGLKGANGANGATASENGQPGSPGGNGGHFYGQAYKFAGSPLTINVSGGNGGNGGNGVDGANGVDGTDGTYVVSHPDSQTFPVGKRNKTENRTYYKSVPGHPATSGGNGGKGAYGGDGGYEGTVTVAEIASVFNKSKGANGNNGTSGKGGLGGMHGKEYNAPVWLSWYYRHTDGAGWEVAPVTLIKEKEKEEDGITPEPTDLVSGSAPSELIPLNKAQLFNDYASFYRTQALIQGVAPFLELFPSILVPPQGN